jgi:hypothetical protein
VVTELVGIRRTELRDPDVPGVDRGHQSLDGAALARRVPAFEDHAYRRTQAAVAELAAVDETEVQDPALSRRQLLCLLLGREAEREVGFL